MQRFSDEDGARGREVCLRSDVGSGAEVGGHADALDGGGKRDELLGRAHGEVVGAGFDGLGARGREAGFEVQDVAFLVVRDLLEFLEECLGQTGVHYFLLAPHG